MIGLKLSITEMKRTILSPEFYVAIIGSVIILFVSVEHYEMIAPGVFNIFTTSVEMSGYISIFIFAAMAHTLTLLDDIEFMYMRQLILRSKFKTYVRVKVASIYFVAVITVVISCMIFCILLHSKFPWVVAEGDALGIYLKGAYSSLLEHEKYVAYMFMVALQLGLLAGTLAVIAAYISLWISNKVAVLAIPVLCMELLFMYAGHGKISIYSFWAYNQCFTSDIANFLFVLVLSICPVYIGYILICKKIKRRL